MSLSLKRHEEGLGVTLFIRSKAGMISTKEAEVLSQDVKRLISDWTQIGMIEDVKTIIDGVEFVHTYSKPMGYRFIGDCVEL